MSIETTLSAEDWEDLYSLRSKPSKTEKDLEDIEVLEDKEYSLYLQDPTLRVSQTKWKELKPARDRSIQEERNRQFAKNLSIATKQAEEKFLKNKESFTLNDFIRVLQAYKSANTLEETIALKRVCVQIVSNFLT